MYIKYRFLVFLLVLFFINGIQKVDAEYGDDFLRDMLTIERAKYHYVEPFPVMYNHLLQGGYFSMPSARMGCEGEIGFGFASVPPYHNYNLRFQLDDRLELTGSYRVFRHVDDPILSPHGFGDLSDKGANLKLAILHPEDSGYALPGIAIGVEDFIGTRNFQAKYIVFTQVIRNYQLEFSLGYGAQRICGFFGGVTWMPFRHLCNAYLDPLCFVAEYDAIPYHDETVEKHPKGQKSRSPINVGLKYRLLNQLDLSLSYIRGHEWAFAISTYYNFGNSKGFLPKIDDPLPYLAPVNIEPIGCRRPEEALASDLLFALKGQELDLLSVSLGKDLCENVILRLHVVNPTYYDEKEVRQRLTDLLARLVPNSIDYVHVVIEATEGFAVHEYRFATTHLESYRVKQMGTYELYVLSPLREVAEPPMLYKRVLFSQYRPWWNFELAPQTHTYFGSATGKFKYAAGLSAALNGFVANDLFYSVQASWLFLHHLDSVGSVDRLNPSQLPNVRTDIVEYYKVRGITLDEAYLQKNWNLGCGYYSKLAAGYFEREYAGVATELLYYPVNTNWSIGLEGALFMKRTPEGIGLTNRVRQFDGFVAHYHPFKFSQAFLDLYYRWTEARLDYKAMIGKFLANDVGIRNEITRYFPSGLRISFWYTLTNGHDKVNGSTYYDKGIAFSMPLDIFYTYSDLSRWTYGMSAWLRDVGIIAETGYSLYDAIRDQRIQPQSCATTTRRY